MQLDDKAINFIKNAKEAGATKEQVADFLRQKGYDINLSSTKEEGSTDTVEESTQEETSSKSPNWLKGTTQAAYESLTANFAPYIEGVKATAPGKILNRIINPTEAMISGAELPSLSDFSPSAIQEQYEQGKQQFQEERKAFAEEHPKLEATGKLVGFLGGLAIPAGTVAKGAVAGTKALQLGARALKMGAPKAVAQAIRSGAPRAAASAATFGAYRTAEGLANEGEGLSPTKAVEEGFKGTLEGTAYSMITGGTYAMLESPLLKSAAEMTGLLGKTTRTGIRAGAAALEGAAVATVASEISRGELPTATEIAGSALAVGGIRTAGGLWQAGRRGFGKLADYTPREKAEMQQMAAQETPLKKEVEIPVENQKLFEDIKTEAKGNISDGVAEALARGRQKKFGVAKALEEEKQDLGLIERTRRFIGKGLRTLGDTLDRYAPLERTHKNVGGKEIGENSAFILRQRDRGGETAVRQKEIVDSLEAAQKEDGLFVEKLDNYLEAKKNVDMLPKEIERLRAKNKNGELDSVIQNQEIKLQDAQKRVSAFEESEPRVVQEAQKNWDYAQEQLDKLHSMGRLSDEFYEELKGNPHYVHSEAILDDMADGLSPAEHDILNKQTGLSSAFKRYGAYEGQRGNLVISNLAQGKKIDYLVNTQRSMKSWLADAKKTGEAKLAPGFDKLKEGQYPTGYNPEKQIFVWENGKATVYDVPENVAKAYNNIRREEGSILRNLRLANNLFKLGTTGISTGFSAMNLVRDMQSVVAGSRSGQFFRPSYVKRAADLYGPGSKNLTGAQKKLRDEIDKKLGTSFSLADTQMDINRDELARVDRMLQAQGQANKEGSFAHTALSLLMKGLSIAKAPAEKTFQSGAKALSFLGNLSEKIGRATVFQTELRRQAGSEAVFERWMKTGNIPKKALDAAGKEMNEVTLDFNRKMSPLIEDLNRYAMPYFKPSLLGAQRLDKILADPEIAPIAWRWISNIGTLQALVNSEMDEKKRAKMQSQLNTEMSAKNFTFVDKEGNIRLVPANQEFGPWYKLTSIPAELLLNRMKDKKQRDDVWDEATSTIRELGENAIPGGYLFNASNFVPTPIGKMIYEEWTNMDSYSKTPIESSAMLRKEKEDRFSATTPKVYRLMSKYIKVGNLQSSPKVWEHRAKKIGSTFAKEMADVGDIVLDYLNIGADEWGLPKRIEEGALLGRFFNRDYTAYARNVQKYEEEIQPLEQAYNSIKRAGKVPDEEQKKKAALYSGIRSMSQQRAQLISANQDLLANLRRKGQKEYAKYKASENKEQAWKAFEKEKELSTINAAKKYYANQQKISDLTDKMLQVVKKKKKEKGIK